MRIALASLLVLALLTTWTPLGDAQGGVLDRGASLSPTTLRIAQGGNATLTLELWNNGTTTDHARIGLNAGLNATLSHPNGTDIAPLSKGAAFITLRASHDQPLVEHQFDVHVTWSSSGSYTRTFRVSVTIEPQASIQPVPGGSRGAALVSNKIGLDLGQTKTFEMWVWNNGTTVDHAYFAAGASPIGLTFKTPQSRDVAPGTASLVEYAVTGDSVGNYSANAKVTWASGNSTTVYLNVTVAHGAQVNVTFEPAEAAVDAGNEAEFLVTLRETAGRAVVVHLDINATRPPGPSTPKARYENMIWSLPAYGSQTVRVAIVTTSDTLVAQHRIVANATDDATREPLGSGFAVLTVLDASPPPREMNVTLDVAPARATVRQGEWTEYRATLQEHAGVESSVNLYVNTSGGDWRTDPRAEPAYVPITLAPYKMHNVTIRVWANDTPPGEHLIRMMVWAASDGSVLARENATLVVQDDAAPPPVVELNGTVRLSARLLADNVTVNASGAGQIVVRVAQTGSATIQTRVTLEAGDGLTLVETPSAAAQLAAGQESVLALAIQPIAVTPPGRYSLTILVDADGHPEARVVLHANVTVLASAGLIVTPEPTQAAPNTTANVTIQLTNAGPTTLRLQARVDEPAAFDASAYYAGVDCRAIPPPCSSPTRALVLTLAPGASATMWAHVEVGDATPGAILRHELTITGDASATADLTILVSPIELPSLAPPVDDAPAQSALASAGGLVKEYPAASASLGIAVGAAVVVPLARRQHLRYLALAATLPLYTRLAKPELLSDERRGQIHALIAAQPGIHMDALRQAVGISTSAIVHHLRMLEKHGFLTSHRDGKLRRFYVSGSAPSALVASPTAMQEQVLGLLAAGPMTRPDIAARLGLSQQGVSYHVKNLERAGRVTVKREGGVTRVHRVVDVVVTTEFTRVG